MFGVLHCPTLQKIITQTFKILVNRRFWQYAVIDVSGSVQSVIECSVNAANQLFTKRQQFPAQLTFLIYPEILANQDNTSLLV